MAYDLLVKNATVVDGTGAPSYRGDVGVRGGKIESIGKLKGSAGKVIDADGLVVAPGFFDMHTHYDCQILWDPLATSSSWHGVTTILQGNCGFTIAPGGPSDSEYLMRLMARVEAINLNVLRKIDWTWDTFGEYLGKIRGHTGVNVAAQVGHCALRYYVMGKESYERAARPDEIDRMKAALRQGMMDGAFGFSSAQTAHHTGGYGEPIPSRLSSREELRELCSVLAEFQGGIIGMNPHPGGGVIAPHFEEVLIELPKVAKKPVLWNQLMHRWDKPEQWRDALAFMDRATAQGADIYAVARCQPMDMEFNLHATTLFDAAPAWKETIAKPEAEKSKAFKDPGVRARLRKDWVNMASMAAGRQPSLLKVTRAKLPQHKELEGQRVEDLAAKAGVDSMDYVLDLSLEEDLDTQYVFSGAMNGDVAAVEQIILHPNCVTGLSDAGAHLDNDCGVDFTDVLLGYWVREKHIMSLEEGVRRLTSMPAKVMGITDRGVIKEGKAADLVVFDPKTLKALPREMASDLPGGGQRIIQRAHGIRAVAVNGQVIIEDGKETGALPGQVISPGKPEGSRAQWLLARNTGI